MVQVGVGPSFASPGVIAEDDDDDDDDGGGGHYHAIIADLHTPHLHLRDSHDHDYNPPASNSSPSGIACGKTNPAHSGPSKILPT